MLTKVCIHCKSCKTLEDFNKAKDNQDGKASYCRACTKIKNAKRVFSAEYKAKRVPYMATYYRKNQKILSFKNTEYYRRTADIRNKLSREYIRAHPEKRRVTLKSYYANNPIQIKARTRYATALRNGSLTKGPCALCGNSKVEGHHCDYTKPLEVLWLCVKHHKAWHRVFLTEQG